MKRICRYVVIVVMVLGFVGCTKEDGFVSQGNLKDTPIDIASVGVTDLTTRLTIVDDKLIEGNMGVTITSDNSDDRYRGLAIRWYYLGNEWKICEGEKVVVFEDNGNSQKIFAYFPYAKDIIEGTMSLPVNLPFVYGGNFEDYDYLYTAEAVALSENPIGLTLKHAFSKVSVYVVDMGSDVEGDVIDEVALVDVPLAGRRSAITGAMNPNEYDFYRTMVLYGFDEQMGEDDNVDEADGADYYVGYVFPNAAIVLCIRVTMRSGRVFTAKASISGGLTDGVHYKIGLKLGKDGVSVLGVCVVDWNEVVIDGGVAKEVTN